MKGRASPIAMVTVLTTDKYTVLVAKCVGRRRGLCWTFIVQPPKTFVMKHSSWKNLTLWDAN
jgi:hypothetical protein